MAARGGADGRVAVGRVNATWGLRGHVKVTPLTSNPDRIRTGAVLLVRGEPRAVLDVRRPRGYPCVVFEGYEDAASAAALRGAMIEIEDADLPGLPDGEFYVHDLVGLAVVAAGGEPVGELAEVIRTGANDVYLVRREGARDALIPAIRDVVLGVDLEAGTMRIEVVPGLLDG